VRHTYSREEFYSLVWTKPLSELGPDLGMSDVALAKTCRRFNIPIPGRGHWAKIRAGKPSFQPPLAERNFGEDEFISFGVASWAEDAQLRNEADRLLLTTDLPPPPEFHESIADLQDRASKATGNVRLTRDLTRAHPAIARILRADEIKLKKAEGEPYPWEWHERLFESPCGRRRARLLDTIFQASTRVGMRCSTTGNMPETFEVSCPNGTTVSIGLDTPKRLSALEKHRVRPTAANERLALQVSWGWPPSEPLSIQVFWQDSEEQKLEDQVSGIVAGVLVALEISQRDYQVRSHENSVKRKEELIRMQEAQRAKAIEEERLRIERLHAAMTEKLLRDAAALRTAHDIRTYVQAVVAAGTSSTDQLLQSEIDAWASASLQHADSIDPVLSRAFLAPPEFVASPEKPVRSPPPPPLPPASEPMRGTDWNPNQKWYSR
jgi:hypothetical protein